jgi:DNA mismatch endonuclease (patch repair protein)
MDIVDPVCRSRMMAGIGPRDTQPELIVRRLLHRLGFRFRLHQTGLPGRPDLVLRRYRLVIFVHGCFWHRHQGCRNCTMPKTRTRFWVKKFDKNVARDARTVRALRRSGWRVVAVWECETEQLSGLERRLLRILRTVPSRRLDEARGAVRRHLAGRARTGNLATL